MGIEAEYKKYQDEFGLVHPSKQIPNEKGELPIAENGIRFTGEMAWAFHKAGILNEHRRFLIIASVVMCEKRTGLFSRHPTEHAQRLMSPDDLLYLALISHLCEAKFIARRVLNYTRWHLGYYDNRTPRRPVFTWSAFVFRQYQIWACFKIAAGLKLNVLDRVALRIALSGASNKKEGDQDGFCLSAALTRITRDVENNEIQAARQAFITHFRTHYPRGYGEVLSRKALYHGEMRSYFEPEHPTCIYMRNEWGD